MRNHQHKLKVTRNLVVHQPGIDGIGHHSWHHYDWRVRIWVYLASGLQFVVFFLHIFIVLFILQYPTEAQQFSDEPFRPIFEVAMKGIQKIEDIPELNGFVVSFQDGIAIFSFENLGNPRVFSNVGDVPIIPFALNMNNNAIIFYHDPTSSIHIASLSTMRIMKHIFVEEGFLTGIAFDEPGRIALTMVDVTDFDGMQVYEDARLTIYNLQGDRTESIWLGDGLLPLSVNFLQQSHFIHVLWTRPGYDSYTVQIVNRETMGVRTFIESWYITSAYSSVNSFGAFALTSSLGITDEFSYTVEIWDLITESIVCEISIDQNPLRQRFGSLDRISALAFNHDGSLLAIGDDTGTVSLWEIEKCAEVAVFQAHYDSVTHLAFARNDEILLSASVDDSLSVMRAWCLNTC